MTVTACSGYTVPVWELGLMPKIDAREAFVALRSDEWSIVTTLRPESDNKLRTLFPERTIIPIDQLQKHSNAGNNQSKYLVVGENDSNYQDTAERLKKLGIESSYWLNGGIDDYSLFVYNRELLLARLRRGPPRQAGCAL